MAIQIQQYIYVLVKRTYNRTQKKSTFLQKFVAKKKNLLKERQIILTRPTNRQADKHT